MRRRLIFCLFVGLSLMGCSDSSSSSEEEKKGDSEIEEPGDGTKQGDPENKNPEPDPGTQEPAIPDADGDTISDDDEGRAINDEESIDTDGDGIPDYLDEDSDNDTIPDRIEANNDGDPSIPPAIAMSADEPAFRTSDADGNGIPDATEAALDETGKPRDTDNDTIPDFISADNDGDTIFDIEEIRGGINPIQSGASGMDCNHDGIPDEFGTAENPIDCDGDTVPDYLAKDSDGDTVEDKYESVFDSNNDGILDRYSLDSDGDTILDEDERGTDEKPADSDDDGIYDFQEIDSDNDGLLDANEIKCSGGKDSRLLMDTDGDGESDLAEYAMAIRFGVDPEALVCDSSRGVTEFISFFFELPRSGEEKYDTLTFNPEVTKADIFINIDNTGSMTSAIEALKSNFTSVIRSAVRERVKDSAFGVSIFRDTDATPVWQLYSPITEADNEFEQKLASVSVKGGETDIPEAGYEALYEIATGDTKSNSSAYSLAKPVEGTIGGAGFRVGALPIILHITDAPASENHGHGKTAAIDALKKIGARVIPLATKLTPKDTKGNDWPTLLVNNGVEIAKSVGSVLPVCAYQQNDKSWGCGENKCCTSDYEGARYGAAPDGDNQCTLVIESGMNCSATVSNGQNALLYKTVLAIEALVKYSTYNVSTRVVGEPIEPKDAVGGGKATTACFIKRIEAVSYEPPENAVVADCLKNYNTVAKDFSGNGYNDGFENFAVGAATPDSPKSKLTFNVVAQNDNCVVKSEEVRSYKVGIEVYDPTTNMLFDKHEVMIVVPAEAADSIN